MNRLKTAIQVDWKYNLLRQSHCFMQSVFLVDVVAVIAVIGAVVCILLPSATHCKMCGICVAPSRFTQTV